MLFLTLMHAAIQFHHKMMGRTPKIQDERAYRVLRLEVEPFEFLSVEGLPQYLFWPMSSRSVTAACRNLNVGRLCLVNTRSGFAAWIDMRAYSPSAATVNDF